MTIAECAVQLFINNWPKWLKLKIGLDWILAQKWLKNHESHAQKRIFDSGDISCPDLDPDPSLVWHWYPQSIFTIPLRLLWPSYAQNPGRRHEVSTGGTDSDWGERFRWVKTIYPQSRILLGFRPLYFGNKEKSRNFGIYSEFFLTKSRFLGGASPGVLNRGDTPPHPPVAMPMRETYRYCRPQASSYRKVKIWPLTWPWPETSGQS